jgi:uncharacterized OsmC-like protein
LLLINAYFCPAEITIMETISTIYTGQLRTQATHLQSGTGLLTDAPVDNQGKGETFSPTDLLATSLGSCMLTIMGIAAREHQFSIDGTEIKIWKIMASSPRKVAEVKIDLFFPPHDFSAKHKKILEYCAKTCPVALSLHPGIKQTVSFYFKDKADGLAGKH